MLGQGCYKGRRFMPVISTRTRSGTTAGAAKLVGQYGNFPKLGVPTIMENQMEKKMENEMETVFI